MAISWIRSIWLTPKGWAYRHVQKKRVKHAWKRHRKKLAMVLSFLEAQPKDPGWLFWVNKREKVLEGYYVKQHQPERPMFVFSFPLTAFSGTSGPKQKEGDGQIPEGWFKIVRLNPESKFHLSMRLNFPRPEDTLAAFPDSPGSDIYIHGGASSTGCVAVGDTAAEWLYVLTFWQMIYLSKPVQVGIFSHAAPFASGRSLKNPSSLFFT